jgi:hypothetical protein
MHTSALPTQPIERASFTNESRSRYRRH